MFKEFKEFALKGNVMDMAIGVIIGGAFQKIVTSLVNDVIMPAISLITGKIDFTNLAFKVGDISIKYGSFLTTILDFLLIAMSLFLMVKYMNKLNKSIEEKNKEIMRKVEEKDKTGLFKKRKKKEEVVPEPTTKICPYCLSEINIKASRCPHCTSELEVKVN